MSQVIEIAYLEQCNHFNRIFSHDALRAWVVSHMERLNFIRNGLTNRSLDDNKSLSDLIQSVRLSSFAVGEDVILAMAEVIHRDIYVCVASTEPLVYKPFSELTEGKLIAVAL